MPKVYVCTHHSEGIDGGKGLVHKVYQGIQQAADDHDMVTQDFKPIEDSIVGRRWELRAGQNFCQLHEVDFAGVISHR